MFSLRFFVAAALVATAVAIPTADSGSCNSGNIMCCNQVQQARSVNFESIRGDQKLALSDVLKGSNIPIGTECTPIGLAAGGQCNQQTVCCDESRMNGLLGINCNAYNGGLGGLLGLTL